MIYKNDYSNYYFKKIYDIRFVLKKRILQRKWSWFISIHFRGFRISVDFHPGPSLWVQKMRYSNKSCWHNLQLLCWYKWLKCSSLRSRWARSFLCLFPLLRYTTNRRQLRCVWSGRIRLLHTWRSRWIFLTLCGPLGLYRRHLYSW